MGGHETMTKRYTIGDNIAIIDNESMTPNGIPTKIFVAEDPFEANKICNELNEQDQKIKELEAEIKSITTNLEEDYILFKRDKNPIETKYCNECDNYETEYEEVYAFGDYETLTKTSCSKGHHILDNSDATNCPDYE